MSATTNIKNRLPSRHVTAGPARAQTSLADVSEIFKKTPDAAGLKPGGRYVAKDMREIGGISLLMKTLLDKGYGDCITVPGRTIAEDLKSVTWNPRPDVVRRAPDGAIAEVTDMSKLKFTGPAGCFDPEAESLNGKLTGVEPAERQTKSKPRQTNHRSGALWKYAQQVGPAVDGAVTHPGGAHEKQCYADS